MSAVMPTPRRNRCHVRPTRPASNARGASVPWLRATLASPNHVAWSFAYSPLSCTRHSAALIARLRSSLPRARTMPNRSSVYSRPTVLSPAKLRIVM